MPPRKEKSAVQRSEAVARMSRWATVMLGVVVATRGLAADRSVTLGEAIRIALERNADVRSAAADLEAARARVAGASLVLQHNPDLDVAAGPRMRAGRDGRDYDVFVSQAVEVAGQRGARREMADAGLRAVEARLGARRVAVAAEVREAFGRALAARAHVELADETVRLAEQALGAVEMRYREGDASLMDVNTARVESGRASRERLLAGQRLAAAVAALGLLLNVDPDIELDPEGTLAGLGGAPSTTSAQLLPQALERRADVVALREEVAAAKAATALADREAFPTPRLGANYRREEGDSIILGAIGIPLPLFNRNPVGRGESRARLAQAEIALQAHERRVAAEVRVAGMRLAAARSAAATFSGPVLRAAQENLALVAEGYRAGSLDLVHLLLIRREALEARRAHIDALAELNAAEAEVSRVTGGEENTD